MLDPITFPVYLFFAIERFLGVGIFFLAAGASHVAATGRIARNSLFALVSGLILIYFTAPAFLMPGHQWSGVAVGFILGWFGVIILANSSSQWKPLSWFILFLAVLVAFISWPSRNL